MALTKQACKNHPNKFTAKRCYYCKDHICVACQQNRFRHIFCSLKCAAKWRVKSWLTAISLPPGTIIWVLLLILSHTILYFSLTQKMAINIEKPDVAVLDTIQTLSTVPAPFGLDSSRQKIKGLFKIELETEEGIPLIIKQNGRFITSRISTEKMTRFENLNLKNGINSFEIYSLNAHGKSRLLDAFELNYKAPRLDYLMRPVTRVITKNKKIALTFDGGSSNKGTAQILNILKNEGLKLTLFLTGEFVKNYPDLVQKALADGHEIGNHTRTHPHLTNLEIDGSNKTRSKVTEAYFNKQLQTTDSLFKALTDQKMIPYWRAPYGEINKEILLWAGQLGYRHIGWSYRCDSWDWVADTTSQLYRSAEDIKAHFLNMEKKSGLNGKIILMHLGSERKQDFPYETLQALITELKAKKYTFVKISELLNEN